MKATTRQSTGVIIKRKDQQQADPPVLVILTNIQERLTGYKLNRLDYGLCFISRSLLFRTFIRRFFAGGAFSSKLNQLPTTANVVL